MLLRILLTEKGQEGSANIKYNMFVTLSFERAKSSLL